MAKLPALERVAWLERALQAMSAGRGQGEGEGRPASRERERSRKARDTDAELLANLVGAWRAQPHVSIYELAAVASARVAKSDELEGLIANLQTRKVDVARERANALAKWPKDPRLAPALLRLLSRTSMRGRTSRPFWTIVFRIVHRQFHAGVAGAIADVDAAELDGDFGDYVDMKLESLRRRCEQEKEQPLDKTAHALVDAIADKLEIAKTKADAKSVDDFIAEIWAAPNDDGLREVFADWLMARNDPRGEFIMLQMTRKRRGLDTAAQKREAQLLREHARAWMGPLEPAIDRKVFRFEGGFLYACRVNPRGLTSTLMTHPAWSTVREYILDGGWEDACDEWLDHMIAFGAKRK